MFAKKFTNVAFGPFSKAKGLFIALSITLCVVFGTFLSLSAQASFFTPKPTESLDGARILVFSKTVGYRHASIVTGQKTITELAKSRGFQPTFTEDAEIFSDVGLAEYDAVVFLNTSGDILTPVQQEAFERYIQSGGGLLGIHAATDTESDGKWPWYTKLIGAHFASHPHIQKAKLVVTDKTQSFFRTDKEAMKSGEVFAVDEWYDLRNLNQNLHHILKIDGSSYEKAASKGLNPMVWSNRFDGGRAYYIGLGHTEESYATPLMQSLMMDGLVYAVGQKNRDASMIRPEPERLAKEAISTDLNEPVAFDFLSPDKAIIIERAGPVFVVDMMSGRRKQVGTVAVDHSNREHGLYGVAVDPDFKRNGLVYLQFSKRATDGKMRNRVGRFRIDIKAGTLTPLDTLIDVYIEDGCCHTGSGMAFDKAGNLIFTTGDNSNPWTKEIGGYAPIDNRPEQTETDSLRSAGNTQDLRGKIIRIRPKPEGGYTIPQGNLFKSAKEGRAEIYAMGLRNPFSLAIDPLTGYYYVGDVGPDSGSDDPNRGPRGYDEINQIRGPGNYGWPLFIGPNYAYKQHDVVKGTFGPAFDPLRPVNESARNTGAKILPPAIGAMIYYPYGNSERFPEVGNGGRSVVAGGVYRRPAQPTYAHLPKRYEGKLFFSDFVRSWIKSVEFDSQGRVIHIENFAPQVKLDNPIDMMFGPDGHLYVLAYGPKWFSANPTSGLFRIVYKSGELPKPTPEPVKAEAPKTDTPKTDGASAHSAPKPDAAEVAFKENVLLLLEDNSCMSCHQWTEESVGPAFKKVKEKYKDRKDAVAYLTAKIAKGGQGVWGSENAMPAFTDLPEADRKKIATYIMTQKEH